MNLTTIIITKNEENNIVDAIETVKFSNQIIVVDNDSVDRTVDLAKKNGAEVVSGTFENFSKQREAALSLVKSDWLFYIDADERVSDELKKEFEKVISENESKDVYKIKRKNFYFGEHEWFYHEDIIRFFRKNALKSWTGDIHESPVFIGEVGEFKGFLNHYTHGNLNSMLKKTIVWSDTEASIRFNANHPKMTWWRFPRVMLTTFFKYFVVQKGYRAGTAGLVESIFQSYSIFITYAKLWEMQNKKLHK
jgi:glycosyltransferase involved in cell wall biosynthesis